MEPKPQAGPVARFVARTPALLAVAVVVGLSLRVLAPELHTAMCGPLQ